MARGSDRLGRKNDRHWRTIVQEQPSARSRVGCYDLISNVHCEGRGSLLD